jgi:hypothetical protein
LDRRSRPSFLQKERQPHAEEYLAARIVHSGQLGSEPPWLSHLVKLKIYDGVSQYEGFDPLWKKTISPKIPPGTTV